MRRTLAIVFGGAVILLLTMIALGLFDVHVLAHSRFGRADGSVDSTLARHRDHLLNALSLGATDAASTLPIIAASVLVIIAAGFVFKRWREPLFVVTAIVGEVTIFVITTLVVHRPRPNVVRLDHAPPTSSFPSGHTAAAVVLFGSIAVLVIWHRAHVAWRRLATAAAIVLPMAVAASRLYRGMHYPTDVIGGALLGFLWLRVAMYAALRAASNTPARSTQAGASSQPERGATEQAVGVSIADRPARS
jgi:membrane-associated phospholipid phosphatase